MNKIKHRIRLFLVGVPSGLMAKIILVERGEEKYTIWDRLRYRLLVGKKEVE